MRAIFLLWQVAINILQPLFLLPPRHKYKTYKLDALGKHIKVSEIDTFGEIGPPKLKNNTMAVNDVTSARGPAPQLERG